MDSIRLQTVRFRRVQASTSSGKNNSGKSRLLKALSEAPVQTLLQEIPKGWNEALRQELARAGIAPPVTVIAARNGTLTIGDAPFTDRGTWRLSDTLLSSLSQASVTRPRNLPPLNVEECLCQEIRRFVPHRLSHVVPTNRMMDEAAKIDDDSSPLPFNPEQWPPSRWAALLETLKSHGSDASREAFKRIQSTFAEITEGLEFELLGGATRSVLIHADGARHALSQCGDGLRDIFGILLYAILAPGRDLFIEEPGLRLHPGAQRRLLLFLEREAKTRAIWLTSHDGPYVFARGVASTVVTTKVDAKIRISRATTAEEHRSCLRDLGWEPAMAMIVDIVIYCEGISDKAAFEAALQDDRQRIVAFPVDGSGAFTDDKQWPKLFQRIRSTAELLPHIKQLVVIDEDGEPEKRRKLCEQLKQNNISAAFLPRQMLESYWLGPELEAIVSEMVRMAAAKRGASVDITLIPTAIANAAGETHDKKRLKAAVERVFVGAFGEREAVEAAIRVAPTAVNDLRLDLLKLID